MLTVFPPQSTNLNFRAAGSRKMISALIFLLVSPHHLSLIFPSSACVSLVLWGNYVSLSVCGQRYILCKVDLEMASRTCRSCSFFFLLHFYSWGAGLCMCAVFAFLVSIKKCLFDLYVCRCDIMNWNVTSKGPTLKIKWREIFILTLGSITKSK